MGDFGDEAADRLQSADLIVGLHDADNRGGRGQRYKRTAPGIYQAMAVHRKDGDIATQLCRRTNRIGFNVAGRPMAFMMMWCSRASISMRRALDLRMPSKLVN